MLRIPNQSLQRVGLSRMLATAPKAIRRTSISPTTIATL
jgi:hypothetical protein